MTQHNTHKQTDTHTILKVPTQHYTSHSHRKLDSIGEHGGPKGDHPMVPKGVGVGLVFYKLCHVLVYYTMLYDILGVRYIIHLIWFGADTK